MIEYNDFIQDNPWTKGQIEKAKTDFRVFVFILWRTLGLPEPTPIQYDIAKSLMNPLSDRFIIQGFRGVAKSYLTCAYAVWQLWKNPQIKVLVVSASKDRADANAVFVKRIITLLPFLKELLPTDKQRNTQNVFDVGLAVPDISPSVKSVGITGQITGSRADLLIADDVEIPNNSATQVQRDKLNESVKEFDSILKPGGQILYLGTPQSEMSLYNELQKRGYTARVWTVEYPSTQKERDEYGDTLAPYIAKDWEEKKGKPTDPMRFDELEIAKRRLSYGKAGFSLQFMLNTNLSDIERYPLKIQDLIVTDLDMKEASLKWNWCADAGKRHADLASVALKGDYFYAPLSRSEETEAYTGTVMAIDPSGRGKDETAYAIIKYLNGYLFVMEVGGYQTGYSEATLTNLANQAKFWGVNTVLYESNFGDGMFGQLLKPVFNRIHPCAVEEVRSMAQKEKRIVETLEPVMMRHKLIVNKTVIKEDYKVYENNQHYSLIYQMTRLTTDRGALAHDDRLDALSMAISYWKDVMDRDEQQGIDEQLDEMLENMFDPDRGLTYIPELHDNEDKQPVGTKNYKNVKLELIKDLNTGEKIKYK